MSHDFDNLVGQICHDANWCTYQLSGSPVLLLLCAFVVGAVLLRVVDPRCDD